MKKPTFIPHWSVIEHAWSAAWRYKQAWAFGLVAFLVDFGGIFESIFKALPIGGRIGGLLDAGSWLQFIIPINVVWDSLVSLVMAPTMTVALLAALGSIFAVVLFLLGASIVTLGVGALVWTAERATDGRPAPWREALINALRNFWPLLVIVMGTKVVTVFFLGISGLGLSWLLRSGSLSAATAFLLSFILFGFVSIAVSLLAVDNVALHGNALTSVLRNQCGQSVLSAGDAPCGPRLDPPRLSYAHLSGRQWILLAAALYGAWFAYSVVALKRPKMLYTGYARLRERWERRKAVQAAHPDRRQELLADATTATTTTNAQCL